jgi:hypothetical protein
MPKWHKTLLVPGDQVTAANNALTGIRDHPVDDNGYRHMFEQQFNDSFVMTIGVNGTEPPQIIAELYDQADQLVASEQFFGDIAQDYSIHSGDDLYEVTLVRAANTGLTAAAVAAYNANPSRCPVCGSEDIYAGRPQIDGKNAWVRVECCACEARWKDLYEFTTISQVPDDFDPPQQHVAQTPQ